MYEREIIVEWPIHEKAGREESGRHVAWTDGACDPNPGRGGWGFVLHRPAGEVVETCGGVLQTTNNRMEMTAVLEVLRVVPTGASVTVLSDSRYVVCGLTIWRSAWRRRDWREKRRGQPMPNRDLWLALERELGRLCVAFRWIRGHSGIEGNERADRLAWEGWSRGPAQGEVAR